MYDHYVTEGDKIISSRIDMKLLPYCTRVFFCKNGILKLMHYRKHFIDRHIATLIY